VLACLLLTNRIAIDYWRLPEDATILDMLYAIRTDEAGHRFYNHSIANLKDQDFNPFAIRKPTGALQGEIIAFSREEGLAWYEAGAKQLEMAKEKVKHQNEHEHQQQRESKTHKIDQHKATGDSPTFATP
jgi:ubiquinol oxidase